VVRTVRPAGMASPAAARQLDTPSGRIRDLRPTPSALALSAAFRTGGGAGGGDEAEPGGGLKRPLPPALVIAAGGAAAAGARGGELPTPASAFLMRRRGTSTTAGLAAAMKGRVAEKRLRPMATRGADDLASASAPDTVLLDTAMSN